jgi:hypothetical protein
MLIKSILAALAVLAPLSACAAVPVGVPPDNGPLWRADGGGVIPSAGAVATTGNCLRVSLSLRLDPAAPPAPPPAIRGAPAKCVVPSVYIGYLRDTLFLEGLDAKGGRLFVASGFNPLHQTNEAPPTPGAAASIQSVDRPAPSVETLISVPVGAPLARFRWYDVDADQQPRLLGETIWTGVQP